MKYLRWLLGIFLVVLIFSAERQPSGMYSSTIVKAEQNQTPLSGRNFVYYTVQPGDNVESVERKFRIVSTEKLIQLNPNLDSGKLKDGQRIKIPLE